MRTEPIEETTEANRVAAESVARGRVLAGAGDAAAEGVASLLPALVRLLSDSPRPAWSAALAQVSELLAQALGADRVGIYLPDPAAAAGASPASAPPAHGFERFVLVAERGRRVRAGDGAGAFEALEAIELSGADAVGRRLLAGRSARVVRPSSLRRLGALSGASGAKGWSRVHATLQVPCPGPVGPVAVLVFDGAFLDAPQARAIESQLEVVAALLAGFLERDRLARELAASRAERAHGERLATLGRVACSVAHDLNNVLTVIVGHADLLELELEDGPGHTRDSAPAQALDEIRLAAARGANLVEDVLAYGRKQPVGAGPVDLAQILTRLGALLQRIAGDAIELSWEIEPELPPVRLECERFERIVVNLVANARHAIEAGLARPGKIELRLERVREAPLAAAAAGGDPSGEQYVRMCVRDNGCGMNAAVRQRVFEPFFTTRSSEGGSGLGLADVAEFAREAGAFVTLESAPGAGCEIALRFPPAISREG